MTAVLKDNIPTYVGMNRLSRPPESRDTHTPAESTEQTAGISCFFGEFTGKLENHRTAQKVTRTLPLQKKQNRLPVWKCFLEPKQNRITPVSEGVTPKSPELCIIGGFLHC